MKSYKHSMIRWCWSTLSVVALVGVLLFFNGCAKKDSSSPRNESSPTPSEPPSTSRPSRPANGKLTEAEMKYGVAPPRNSENFVYRDDVVIVDHGADAVRSLSPDGMTWTIDATAPHSDEIQPDKIMFLTNRAVGRVLRAERKGNDLAVILGPFELTDIYKEAHVTVDQPLDLNSMVFYPAPYPGMESTTIYSALEVPPDNSLASGIDRMASSKNGPRANAFRPSAFHEPATTAFRTPARHGSRRLRKSSAVLPGLRPVRLDPAPRQSPDKGITIKKGDFTINPFSNGLGVQVEYSKEGLNVKAVAALLLNQPYVLGKITIFPDKRVEASLELMGVAGFQVAIEAESLAGIHVNIGRDGDIAIPGDLSLNLFGVAAPFVVTFRQHLILKTDFSAKNSALGAYAKYSYSGTIRMSYSNGSFKIDAPVFTDNLDFLRSIGGVSIGPNALIMGLQGKVIVGVGAGGFVAGPYVGYNTSVSIVKGPDTTFAMAVPPCRASDLIVSLNAGVGYAMPQPLTDAINFFLRALNLEEIKGEGGIQALQKKLLSKHDTNPANCA
jgi:hypothetical protein